MPYILSVLQWAAVRLISMDIFVWGETGEETELTQLWPPAEKREEVKQEEMVASR